MIASNIAPANRAAVARCFPSFRIVFPDPAALTPSSASPYLAPSPLTTRYKSSSARTAATNPAPDASSSSRRSRSSRGPSLHRHASAADGARQSPSVSSLANLWVKRSVSRTSYRSNVEREVRVKSDDGESP
ncbi:uncharacterized protein MICPUCDRAFT_68821 [Micromonas pusilla CCMP1545]|uniref:Predicted protein n=1 Tax=Micromonas pusilla (strain CCMP1545) TaxID=564608 RepID=C1N473_MICPC|nr:uncharacterized protein MICPUCDRAFT_68821 [Micromonas pusilla CCMP1545]EEH53559.1 predicted protein [Micromonas pusilla CCMP1545]|eukprot:XP_003062740.1 predicted protein [Micromonas pusilla CCMP1545]